MLAYFLMATKTKQGNAGMGLNSSEVKREESWLFECAYKLVIGRKFILGEAVKKYNLKGRDNSKIEQ